MRWHSEKVCETNLSEKPGPPDIPTALAASRDRVAVAFARSGVRIWMFSAKGTVGSSPRINPRRLTRTVGQWQPQRPIIRQNVSTISFVEDGTALLGGTKDGVLWYCQVQGLIRAYAFFKSEV